MGLTHFLCPRFPPARAGANRGLPFALQLLLFCWLSVPLKAADNWEAALARMPLLEATRELNRSNCVSIMLHALQSNTTVKALIFMPGATDEFYMFRRARAALTNEHPCLLDAVVALTNQTQIRATFYAPFLLMHTDEDPLEPLIRIEHQPTADRLHARSFVPHLILEDRDWNFVQPLLKKRLRVDVQPWRHSYESWHFYRHSLTVWGLTGWEALEAIALAGKTRLTVQWHRVIFEGDERVRATPKLETFPR